MNISYKAIVVTEDARLAGQIENIALPFVSSVDTVSLDEATRLHDQSGILFFLDANQSKGNTAEYVQILLQTGENASVFIVEKEKNVDSILKNIRAGAADCFMVPLGRDEIVAAIQRVFELEGTGSITGDVTAVFSLKGGQGVTSVSTNLVDHIHKSSGSHCLLTDLNLYMGHAAMSLDTKLEYTPFELINDLNRADDNLLFSSMTQHKRGFYVLGVSEKIEDATSISGEDISEMLDLLQGYLGYLVLDLPHDFSPLTLAGLDAADRIFMVVQQDIPSLKGTQLALRVFSDLDYPEDKIKIIVNRHISKNMVELTDIEKALRLPVYATISNDYGTLAEVYNKGQTVDEGAGNSALNYEYAELASRITGIPVQKQKRKTWLDLLPV